MKKLELTIVILLSLFSTLLFCKSSKKVSSCHTATQAGNELNKWMVLALQSDASIGCPSTSITSPLVNLETISKNDSTCAEKANILLLTFYSIFTQHPNYRMCGLLEKKDLLLSRISADGKICINEPSDKISACFDRVNMVISSLKIRGEIRAAFELAKKTANSHDITGISQMILATMYLFGESTEKNTSLAIKWYKEALQKVDNRETRINTLILLGAAYESLNDNTSAILYYQRCADMGDSDCKKGYARLKASSKYRG